MIDWTTDSPTARLEEETFTQFTEHDALNRMTRLYNWHRDPRQVAVYEPSYNGRGLLKAEDLILRRLPRLVYLHLESILRTT